jgi:hypothetical protein
MHIEHDARPPQHENSTNACIAGPANRFDVNFVYRINDAGLRFLIIAPSLDRSFFAS